MKKIISFVRKQAVLVVAWLLAIISAFFVHPDAEYIGYIDFRSLGILWSLMVIMADFRMNGVFEKVGKWLLGKVHKMWQLAAVHVGLCFVLSMFVTNDVALITFVPFAILILQACDSEKLMIPVIVLQTIAANLGSMLTPIGNPQNLYLFGLGGFTLVDFVTLMLPYSSVSLILLIICVFVIGIREKGKSITAPDDFSESEKQETTIYKKGISEKSKRFEKITELIEYAVLFVFAILTVLHIFPIQFLILLILVDCIINRRNLISQADYALLFTFIGFFIFTGNIARIDFINEALQSFVGGREVLFGIAASQVISNVPAALLLSGFSESIANLIIGVNLGGLGTLIASMASLISYKFYAATKNSKSGKYMVVFTALNVAFLIVLVVVQLIIA